MAAAIERVACIGLGRMGAGIARNIQKAGFGLVVYNRTAAKAEPLVRAGGRLAGSAREAAVGADVVVTSLMDDRSVLDALEGPDGVLAGLPRDAVHIGTSTVSPRCAREVAALHAAHGSRFVAAPCSGVRTSPRRASCAPSWLAIPTPSRAVRRCSRRTPLA